MDLIKAKRGDLIILLPKAGSWYDSLGIRNKLEDKGFSVVVLDRFSSSTSRIIPEKEMNRLGWYKNE